MRMAVSGSIASDHLMTFAGRFADNLLAEHLNQVSVSFLVNDLQIRNGGTGANVAFGLAACGLQPMLVGSVGADAAGYVRLLEQAGVDCRPVVVHPDVHTARFICTTDTDQAQIASFYPGAMSRAGDISLEPWHSVQPFDLVIICANDPAAMARHTRECRERGIPFVADPSQQLAFSSGDDIHNLIAGAAYLVVNTYEAALLASKTGLSQDELLTFAPVVIITDGADGVVVRQRDHSDLVVPAVPARTVVDPTGVGDGFRAGFFAGISWGLSLRRCAQWGAAVATCVLESVGTQEYRIDPTDMVSRLGECYGAEAAAEIFAARPATQLPAGALP